MSRVRGGRGEGVGSEKGCDVYDSLEKCYLSRSECRQTSPTRIRPVRGGAYLKLPSTCRYPVYVHRMGGKWEVEGRGGDLGVTDLLEIRLWSEVELAEAKVTPRSILTKVETN